MSGAATIPAPTASPNNCPDLTYVQWTLATAIVVELLILYLVIFVICKNFFDSKPRPDKNAERNRIQEAMYNMGVDDYEAGMMFNMARGDSARSQLPAGRVIPAADPDPSYGEAWSDMGRNSVWSARSTPDSVASVSGSAYNELRRHSVQDYQ